MKIISIVLLSVSSLIIFTGAFFKIMHWPGASPMILAGMIAVLIGVGLLVYDSLNKKDKNKYMDF